MSFPSIPNSLRAARDSFSRAPRNLRTVPDSTICSRWLAASMLLMFRIAPAQEAMRSSLAGQAAAEARHLQLESMPYTFKTGDFRLLVTPSLGVDWNDNINTSKSDPHQDFIIRPTVGFGASYPVTQRNLLQFSVSFGYDKYIKHDELSTWRIGSGSQLSFDIYIKDLLINLHDRFSYSKDSAQEASIAGTAQYGIINNTAGLLATWDLQDLTLSLGYDHQNAISPEAEFNSQDHSSELFVGRAGFRFDPTITAGLEGTASFTAYDQKVLNDNKSYSAGVYADWQPGSYFHVQPRAGYTIFQFQQTSQTIQTGDLN